MMLGVAGYAAVGLGCLTEQEVASNLCMRRQRAGNWINWLGPRRPRDQYEYRCPRRAFLVLGMCMSAAYCTSAAANWHRSWQQRT